MSEVLEAPATATEDQLEAAINAVVDATPVFEAKDEQPSMSPQVLWAFCTDVAQNIMPMTEIASRYGFVDGAQLKDFLVTQHMVRKRVKELRAIFNSDDNVEIKIRKVAGAAVLTALPGTAQIMLNPRLPDSTRMEALKEHAKIAGVGVYPGNKGGGAGGDGSAGRFSVNITFANAGRTETFTTIEGTKVSEGESP